MSIITTISDFELHYLVSDGMLANAENINKSPYQLKLEIDEVKSLIDNSLISNQVLFPNDAISISGKTITLKKGDGSTETETFTIFDTKMDRITSVDNKLPRFDGINGDLQLSTASIDDNGNLIITGSVTSNTGVFVGNSSSATKLQTARTIGGVSFDGTANISLPGVNITGNQNTTGNAATATTSQGSTFFTNGLTSENQIGVNLTGYSPVYIFSNANFWGLHSDQGGNAFEYNRGTSSFNFYGNATTATNTTGNSGTATKLQTARTIGGVSFDGTANISLPGVNIAGNQNTTGNAATATKLQTARTIGGVTFDGTASIDLPGVNIAGNQNTTGNAATANSASGSSFWTNGSGSENQIGVNLTGYNPVYLYSNSSDWGIYSATGGSAFQYTRSTGLFNFNGNANTASNTTGNSGTATKLQTARSIGLGGVLSGSANFDGSGNITITASHLSSPTITLTGGITGAGTMSNLGSVSIATTVANDSHTHDTRYYTQSQSNSLYVNATGDYVTGSIYPATSGNIDLGLGSNVWRYIWGTATSALYADLAEKYITDKEYPIGTVLEISGNKEVTIFNGGPLAGPVSENPGFRLNEESEGQFVALKGKVPVLTNVDIKHGQYCIAVPGGTVIGINKSELTFEKSLNLVGIALEDSKDGTVMVKV